MVDRTLQLLTRGYDFLPDLHRREGSPVVRLRVLGRPAVSLHGVDAAQMFYTSPHLQRRKAVPLRVQKTLMGIGGVQSLDGDPHRERKAMFLSQGTPDRVTELVTIFEEELETALERWSRDGGAIEVMASLEPVLLSTGARWMGIPLRTGEATPRGRDMAAMVDGFASAGPRYWRARLARSRSERWVVGMIHSVRRRPSREEPVRPWERIAQQVAEQHGSNPRLAAVEILNLLRPLVAVNRFMAYALLAMQDHPPDTTTEKLTSYVEEVRRYFPFTPFVGAKVSEDFDWCGSTLCRGWMALLDIYGQSQDPDVWERPETFRPDRFMSDAAGPFTHIPQGGGDPVRGHRCAGEDITVELTKAFVRRFSSVAYEMPDQDLTIDRRRIPARPASGMLVRDVTP